MSTVFDHLDSEWARLATNRLAARRLADVRRLAGGARNLGDVERYVRTATAPEADSVLLALVARAVVDDQLAARVLLQLLLPGTRNLARRWWALGDAEERAAAAVAAVYRRIRSYPLARRPGRVAANILMDAAHELRAAVVPANVELWADPAIHHRHDPPQVHPAVELADVLAEAVHDGVLTLADARLVAETRIAGRRVADLADHQPARPRTLWDRRQRAERKLMTRRPTLASA